MKDTLESLISKLRYYQSEHGGFEVYIPETVKKLKALGYRGPWNFNDDDRKLGSFTEELAKNISRRVSKNKRALSQAISEASYQVKVRKSPAHFGSGAYEELIIDLFFKGLEKQSNPS